MYLRILTVCILLSSSSVELISVRQKVRTLGERLHLLERKHVLESGDYQAQIGEVLDILHGLNSSSITYAGGNDGETTNTDRLEQDIQAKVNATEQRLERYVEVFKHTTNKQMQAVLRGIRNEKVLRKRSAERVMNQLESLIRQLVTTMTDRFDEQDAANQELMKQVSDRIETVRNKLKDDITDMNDTLRHYGSQCVLDNAVTLKTIEDTVNASQCHPNENEETVKATDDSLTNPTETRESETCTTCPPDWTLFPSTNSCYKLFLNEVTFVDAVKNCIDVNSRMTDITSDSENEFVLSLTGSLTGSKFWTWIGLTDEETAGVWRWIHNNHTASYVNWRPGQSNGGTGRNCAVLDWSTHKWYSYWCPLSVKYICKMVLPQTC